MYCTKCGKEIPDNSNFCTFCGQTVQDQPVQNNNGVICNYAVQKTKLPILPIIIGVIGIVLIIIIIRGVAGMNMGESDKTKDRVKLSRQEKEIMTQDKETLDMLYRAYEDAAGNALYKDEDISGTIKYIVEDGEIYIHEDAGDYEGPGGIMELVGFYMGTFYITLESEYYNNAIIYVDISEQRKIHIKVEAKKKKYSFEIG